MVRRIVPIALAVCSLLIRPADAACPVEKRAEIAVAVTSGQLTAAGAIDGKPVRFVIDTGAQRTVLNEPAVLRLGLARDEWVSSWVHGIGGFERHRNARLSVLELGGLRLHRRGVEAETSVAVVPTSAPGRTEVGMLGIDYLSGFDIDLDLPAGRMTLYQVADCAGDIVPWAAPFATVAATRLPSWTLLLPVRANGQPLHAIIDTGASQTAISTRAATRIGITPEITGRDPPVLTRGVGKETPTARQHVLASLQVGPVVQPDMPVLALALPGTAIDMQLGIDWLRAHRIWLSMATSRVFVAR
jgi:predicted aspartyl protease